MKFIILLVLSTICLQEQVYGRPQWPFRSSDSNRALARNDYRDSPLQLYVATAFGDEIPNMRDDLINRKNNGEGVVSRHLNAWIKGSNWKVDPSNDFNERFSLW